MDAKRLEMIADWMGRLTVGNFEKKYGELSAAEMVKPYEPIEAMAHFAALAPLLDRLAELTDRYTGAAVKGEPDSIGQCEADCLDALVEVAAAWRATP